MQKWHKEYTKGGQELLKPNKARHCMNTHALMNHKKLHRSDPTEKAWKQLKGNQKGNKVIQKASAVLKWGFYPLHIIGIT